MKIYSALQIGEYHTNHCEDYLFFGEMGSDKVVCAVMDGCTTATDSYFVSTLVGKLLRKIIKGIEYKELYDIEKPSGIQAYFKLILQELFRELNVIKNQLMLEKMELLTTLILLLFDKKGNEGVVMVIGDGFVCVDGEVTAFDQENKPDYLGFHLQEEFETWYSCQTQKILFNNIKDIGIATDGLGMFAAVKKSQSIDRIDPIQNLLVDTENSDHQDMLNFKLKRLEHHFGLKPTDDLAIIRLIME